MFLLQANTVADRCYFGFRLILLLSGAAIIVEHCDAATAYPPSKGFLSFEEELQSVKDANQNLGADVIGVSVNWARSVLEVRVMEQ